MPKPNAGESRDAYMERCIPHVLDDGSAADQDQAVAMCSSMWSEERAMKRAQGLQRAFSLLTVKQLDERRREISGVASTPTLDRVGDSVSPLGARFKTPMPLLLYHKADMPVGTVDFARPTEDGIPFTASLPIVTEPGVVQDRVNEAFHSIKYKLLAAVSIGFRPLADGMEVLKGGGILFKEWEWLETSLVSVPSNPEAVLLGFKSMDPALIRKTLSMPRRGVVQLESATIRKARRRPGVVYLDKK